MPNNATLTITPNPIPLGTVNIVLSGDGYKAGEHLQIITSRKSGWATADDDGEFSINYSGDFSVPETAKMQVWSTGRRGQVLAEATYIVE